MHILSGSSRHADGDSSNHTSEYGGEHLLQIHHKKRHHNHRFRRPNRLQYRDLWDILFLQQRTVELDASLVERKLEDRQITSAEYCDALARRIQELSTNPGHRASFAAEMKRFLPRAALEALEKPEYWQVLIASVQQTRSEITRCLRGKG